jgi:hypothetical protein
MNWRGRFELSYVSEGPAGLFAGLCKNDQFVSVKANIGELHMQTPGRGSGDIL